MVRDQNCLLRDLPDLQHVEYFQLLALLDEVEHGDGSRRVVELGASVLLHVMVHDRLGALRPLHEQFEVAALVNTRIVARVERQ